MIPKRQFHAGILRLVSQWDWLHLLQNIRSNRAIMQTNYVNGVQSSLRSKQTLTWLRYPSLMKPKGSLPSSQEPTTGPHPKPQEASIRPHILFP
jgi:hypothetical protein